MYCSIVITVLGVLQSGALTRECDVAASVSLCAAVLLGSDPSNLALELARAFLSDDESVHFSPQDNVSQSAPKRNLVHPSSTPAESTDSEPTSRLISRLPINTLVLNPLGSDLRTEFGKCTEFGRLCILRSLLTTTPRPELNRPLLRSTPREPLLNPGPCFSTGFSRRCAGCAKTPPMRTSSFTRSRACKCASSR